MVNPQDETPLDATEANVLSHGEGDDAAAPTLLKRAYAAIRERARAGEFFCVNPFGKVGKTPAALSAAEKLRSHGYTTMWCTGIDASIDHWEVWWQHPFGRAVGP
jgi:hypothetical protein